MSPPKQSGKGDSGINTILKRAKPDSSPNKGEEDTATDQQAMLLSFMKEMNDKMKQLSDNVSSLRTEFTVELATIKASVEGWQEEKKRLTDKQKELESRIDRLERDAKRKKVVITGLLKGSQTAKVAVNALFRDSLKLQTEVTEAFEIKLKSGKTKIIAAFKSFEEKVAVMREKRSLPANIFINDDLIARDQYLQFKAREFVKSMGPGQKEVKIRRGSVLVNGTAYSWDESSECFVERKN